MFNLRLTLMTGAILMSSFLLSCKSNDHNESAAGDLNTDTRVWVQQAYDTLDYMILNAPFNKKRAAIIKQEFDQETDAVKKMSVGLQYAQELLKTGQLEESIKLFNSISDFIDQNKIQMPPESRRNLLSIQAIAHMRYGEIQNCVQNHNHQSCFIPIAGGGIHTLPAGSENAIIIYEELLKEFPEDLESKYLLNIAYMTLGKYPNGVPAQFRLDPAWFKSKVNMKPFKDIAPEIGVNRNGHAGGVVLDDFNNDGWIDIVVTSWSSEEELILYINNGDGSFTDKTAEYGIKGHVGILHLNQTDFNNDGWIDLYLTRGAWMFTQGDIPNTLLMNTGNGSFEDVTLKAGLTKHAPGQAVAWGDYNLDGFLDLLIANESIPEHQRGIDLYINQQDGTFKNEAAAWGLTLNHFFKGCVATDVNNDRWPDLYFSSQFSGNSLFINQGFAGRDSFVFATINPGGPLNSFPCWNFDYDNDGLEDLFVSAYTNDGNPATHWINSQMGKADPTLLPKLYHNKGNLQWEEVGVQMGLNEIAFTMGCNFGDINTDGFLDFYLSTGNPQYQAIVPNKMYLNMDGKRFEDVSYSGGFANIQKGHAVSFGDLDRDGDEDIYVVIGGAFDGDNFYNCLFENPNEAKNNWLVLKLEGTQSNKMAVGARIAISIQENGRERMIYRTVTSGASFGANSLNLEVGLRKADAINKVTVTWPCKDCPEQIFKGMEINKAYKLTQEKVEPEALVYTAAAFKKNAGHDHGHH